MAITYQDFLNRASKTGLKDRLTTQDLQVAQRDPAFGESLLGLIQDQDKATTQEQRLLASEAANQLRKSYGVYNTGDLGKNSTYAGSHGSTINDLLGKIENYGSFQYGDQEAYKKLLQSIVEQKPFEYELESDPSWSAYKKAYLREGERASANALAQAAAASGGTPSSYALTAAQQAGNYYAGKLGDMIPTLEQDAYSRYLGDLNSRLESLSAMEADRAFDYSAWLDQYNMFQNSLGNYQDQDATDYQRYLDALQVAAVGLNGGSQSGLQEVADSVRDQDKANESNGTMWDRLMGRSDGEQAKEQDEGLTVDWSSLDDLGYGMLNEDGVEQLIREGVLEEVIEGNTIRFRLVDPFGLASSSEVFPMWMVNKAWPESVQTALGTKRNNSGSGRNTGGGKAGWHTTMSLK